MFYWKKSVLDVEKNPQKPEELSSAVILHCDMHWIWTNKRLIHVWLPDTVSTWILHQEVACLFFYFCDYGLEIRVKTNLLHINYVAESH